MVSLRQLLSQVCSSNLHHGGGNKVTLRRAQVPLFSLCTLQESKLAFALSTTSDTDSIIQRRRRTNAALPVSPFTVLASLTSANPLANQRGSHPSANHEPCKADPASSLHQRSTANNVCRHQCCHLNHCLLNCSSDAPNELFLISRPAALG